MSQFSFKAEEMAHKLWHLLVCTSILGALLTALTCSSVSERAELAGGARLSNSSPQGPGRLALPTILLPPVHTVLSSRSLMLCLRTRPGLLGLLVTAFTLPYAWNPLSHLSRLGLLGFQDSNVLSSVITSLVTKQLLTHPIQL